MPNTRPCGRHQRHGFIQWSHRANVGLFLEQSGRTSRKNHLKALTPLTCPLPAVPEVSLNPQPLPPEPPDEHPLVRSAGLTGVAAVYALPRMSGDRIAITAMADGRMLVLEA